MPINDALFNLIQNDAFISGTYKLEGQVSISETMNYLKEYALQVEQREGKLPVEYQAMMNASDFLIKVTNTIANPACSPGDIQVLIKQIMDRFYSLKPGETLLLPGGWYAEDSGHAMIYEFTRGKDNCTFTVYNSGAGLNYHARKSGQDKELYNPTKSWFIPYRVEDFQEIAHFIARLIDARLKTPVKPRTQPMDEKFLYETILPSIAHVNHKVKEINTSDKLPDHVWTAGQLSGSCPQRVLHQMLKVKSASAQSYPRFMFDFRIYALNDYTGPFLKGAKPLTQAAAKQIHLAIDTNLKILNTEHNFSKEEKQACLKQLRDLRERLNECVQSPIRIHLPNTEKPSTFPTFSKTYAGALMCQAVITAKNKRAQPKPFFPEFFNIGEDSPLNIILSDVVQSCKNIKDPELQYEYLEKLILSLPLNKNAQFKDSIYKKLQSAENHFDFQQALIALLEILNEMQAKGYTGRTASFNILKFSLLSLLTDSQTVLTGLNKLPSYETFTNQLMVSLVANHDRNAFLATHNPQLDQRFAELQQRYPQPDNNIKIEELYRFLNSTLQTEPELYRQLSQNYRDHFSNNPTPLHKLVRTYQLEAFYMVYLYLTEQDKADSGLKKEHYIPKDALTAILDKMGFHFNQETRLRNIINPLWKETSRTQGLDVFPQDHILVILTPLAVIHLIHCQFIEEYNAFPDSPALEALKADVPTMPGYFFRVTAPSANNIQLSHRNPEGAELREFLTIRNNKTFQIPFTLSTFNRKIAKLASVANQRMLELNLFQPGLLLACLVSPEKTESFLSQLDELTANGLSFFNQNGQYSLDSLFFLRLQFLVARYFAMAKHPEGNHRLQSQQENILQQLTAPNPPEVTYALHELFLVTFMARLDSGDFCDSFKQAMKSFMYLKNHNNPHYAEHTSHARDVDLAMVKLQRMASTRQEADLLPIIQDQMRSQGLHAIINLPVKGSYPLYQWVNAAGEVAYEFNIWQGRGYHNGLAETELPTQLKSHLNSAQINPPETVSINVEGDYVTFDEEEHAVEIFNVGGDRFELWKEWTIRDQKTKYERIPEPKGIPESLQDEKLHWWQSIDPNSRYQAIVVQNNVPIFGVSEDRMFVLAEQGQQELLPANNLPSALKGIISRFENENYCLVYKSADKISMNLKRFGLTFEARSEAPVWILPQTGEWIDHTQAMPIDSRVKGLVLKPKDDKKKEEGRILVPVALFYAQNDDLTDNNDGYPVVHDNNQVIAKANIKDYCKKNAMLVNSRWTYEGSERYVSFTLKNGKPVAATVEDSLYLAYLYLTTDHPEKAWEILSTCTNLSGSFAELQYIRWICAELPHVLPSNETDYTRNRPTRDTPPVVACQLKVLSLLSQSLAFGGSFPLTNKQENVKNANDLYEQIEKENCSKFLQNLPDTLTKKYSRYLKMERSLEGLYQLDHKDKQHVQEAAKVKHGTMGAHWLRSQVEPLQQERAKLTQKSATKPLQESEKKRLAAVTGLVSSLKSVMNANTAVQPRQVDLTLPTPCGLDTRFLSEETVAYWKSIQDCIKANEQFSEATLESAVNALSSNMSDDVFIRNIQVYYQILRSDNPVLRQRLLDFCTKTLLANHMIPLKKQESNLPLLCTLFYRLFSTPAGYLNLCESGGPLIHDKILSFEGLITIAGEQTTAKPLPISYMQDNPSLLLSAKELMAAAHADTVQPVNRLHASPLPSAALTNLPKDMVELLKRFRALETTAHAKISKMTVPSDPMQAFAAEASAGKELYALEETQKKLVSACVAKGFVDKLSKSVDAELPNILADKELAWKNALELANRGPADPEAKLKWAIACESKARAPITKADLLSLYLGANPISSMKKTGLTEEQAITLHDDIHKALVLGIREQNLKKIAKNFKKAVSKNDMSAAVLAFELLSKPEIPLLDEPAMVLFQHEENLTLRPRQVEALHSLLKKDVDGRFYNLIEKIIMGGGKSKILLPILAEKKAQGDNLVVIEVPQSLLHSTYADLNRLSQRLYGKEATLFQFNRDTPCAPADLEKLYGCLLQTMVNRGYLLTTGETMQALELKYIELLLVKPEKQDSLWEQQLAWCDKIMSLFKHHGDCIIDEVHQGLWINKKLNYTSRDSMAIDANLIKNALALYSFINKNVLIEAQTYTEQHDWTSFKQKLALTLCRDASSPLKSFITKALLQHKHGNFRALLLAYLTNTEGSNPDEVLCYANDEEKSMLVYFKQEISVLLPQTLTRRLNENYGASKLAHSDREKALAIPYTANNVPNERSRFGNELEAMNYTIQMMLLQGLTKEHIKERIDAWQTAARYESSNDPEHQAMDSTLTAKSFACLVKPLNISLSKADTNHPATLELIYQQLRFNQTLMHEFLQEQVLPQIRQEAAVIHSDAYNHVDIFNTVQGLSGTPHNYRSYHPKLAYDTSLSLGTDMYVFQVMKAKNTQVTGLDYENLSQFVAAALTGPKAAKRRAFIDIGASFKGIGNRAVAEAIATFYRGEYTNRPIPIKHVLYFNDEQRLCALDVANPKEIIVLDSMDKKAINQRLRSKPEERFTYYDQIHTLGIDIQQADDADAAVFVDEKVSMQSFLQGCMRMRKLNQGQSLEIIVPKRLESMNSDALLTSYLLADNNRTQLEASSATKGKLHNFARRTAMNIIQDLGSERIREKARLAQHFRGFLETIPSSDLVGLYGPISKPQEASEIFKHYKGILLGLWKTGLASANNAAIPTLDTMDAQLQGIIDKSLDFCLKKYNEQEASPDNQKEVQKEVHKEIQKAVQKLTEAFNEALEEAYRFPWPVNTNNAYQDPKLFEKMTIPVNSVGKTNLFSPNFLMSKNFALTYRTDKPIIDGYSKPVFPIWYHWQGNTLRATLITPEEAAELSARIQNTKGSWIAATDNTYLEGDKPPLSFVQDPEYQALREQACYFNGEFSGLVNQKAPWHWLKDRLAEKVAFFETHLLPVRPDAAPEFQALKEISLSLSNAGFAHIAKHPFEDYRNADWQALFPDTLQSHAKQYQKVAEVFSFLNRHWFKDEISLAVLQKKFHLPLQSLTFVNAHIEHLSMLKAALSFLQTNANAVHTSLFLRFPHAVRTALENCVQTSFARMYFNQGFTLETILKPSPEQEPLFLQANFKALLLLNTHAPLKNHAVLEKLMISIVDKVSTPAFLEPLLDNPDLPLEVAMDIASNEHFEIGFCAKLIEHNPHPSLGLVLLRRFGNEVAAMLPLAAMIEQAQKDDLPVLAPLVNSSLLSRAEFTALQRKCKTSAGGLSPRSFGRFFGDEMPEEQDDVAEHKHEFS